MQELSSPLIESHSIIHLFTASLQVLFVLFSDLTSEPWDIRSIVLVGKKKGVDGDGKSASFPFKFSKLHERPDP